MINIQEITHISPTNYLGILLNKKYIKNLSEFCDKINHPLYFSYRKYKRGLNRCSICGAKIGEVLLDKPKSYAQRMICLKPSV